MKKLSLMLFVCIVGVNLYAQQVEHVSLEVGGRPWVFRGARHAWSGFYEFVSQGDQKVVNVDRRVEAPPARSYDSPYYDIFTVTGLNLGSANFELKHHPGSASRSAGIESKTIIFDVVAPSESVNLTRGQTWNLSLDSNPTTGYSWQTQVSPEGQDVIKVTSEYAAAQHPVGMTGVGGKHTWTVTAVKQGEAKVELRYVRPWEVSVNAVPDKVYRFTVTN